MKKGHDRNWFLDLLYRFSLIDAICSILEVIMIMTAFRDD